MNYKNWKNKVRDEKKISFKIESTLYVSSQVLFWSIASNNDGFRTVICYRQNLSLIKFHYSGIKIIILPFSYLRKQKHIEVHTELLKFFCHIWSKANVRFVQLIYNAINFGLWSFHYLPIKAIIFTFYWCVNDDHSWSRYRNNRVFLLIMT